jgi:hypothetical protein
MQPYTVAPSIYDRVAVSERPSPMREVRGLEPCHGHEFSISYETPELLGAGDSHVFLSNVTIKRDPVCVRIQNINHVL